MPLSTKRALGPANTALDLLQIEREAMFQSQMILLQFGAGLSLSLVRSVVKLFTKCESSPTVAQEGLARNQTGSNLPSLRPIQCSQRLALSELPHLSCCGQYRGLLWTFLKHARHI
jgi:hypothetical protein